MVILRAAQRGLGGHARLTALGHRGVGGMSQHQCCCIEWDRLGGFVIEAFEAIFRPLSIDVNRFDASDLWVLGMNQESQSMS
jgi:hypothetical protein